MLQQSLQKQREQVENQLSSFLKRIKQREEQHHRLCDHTNRLLSRQSQLEQCVFIHDEITKHQNRLRESQVAEMGHGEMDERVAERSERVLGLEEQNVLGRRIMSRILEVTYAAIQAFRQYREYYSVKYVRFKEKCLKIVNDGGCTPGVAVRFGSGYLAQKMSVEHEGLGQTITCLQLTDYQPFLHLKSTYYELLIRKENSFAIRREIVAKSEKVESPRFLTHKTSLKKEMLSTNLQREKKEIRVRPKAKSTKQDEKQKQKQRKAQARKIKKLASNLWQVMDICRQDLIQDLTPATNRDWQTKKLMGGLVTRNRVNQQHISTFLQKQPLYNDITSRPLPKCFTRSLSRCHSLQKQLVEDNDVEFIPNSFGSKNMKTNQSPRKTSVAVKRRQSMRVVPLSSNAKNSYKNQRATVNNIEDHDRRKPIFSSHKQINQPEHVVEINLKGAIKLPKPRFPQITAPRASSVSKKIQKEEQPSPIRTKLEIKSSSTYFDEIEKRIVKFCELKKNVV